MMMSNPLIGVGVKEPLIADIFSTDLYYGAIQGGVSQNYVPVSNGLKNTTAGGLVWIKPLNSTNHSLIDTARGRDKHLATNLPDAGYTTGGSGGYYFGFDANGYTIQLGRGDNTAHPLNTSGVSYIGWNFLRSERFFDIVTYGGSNTQRLLSHGLKTTPGMIIVKGIGPTNWTVYHCGFGSINQVMFLDDPQAVSTDSLVWGGVEPNDTTFSVGYQVSTNSTNYSYVAYLFAKDTANIKCHAYVGTGGVQSVSLGWRPQWIMLRNINTSMDWNMVDNVRGPSSLLVANKLTAQAGLGTFSFDATGFTVSGSLNTAGQTYIFTAIRSETP